MKLNLSISGLNKKEKDILLLYLYELGLDYFVVSKEIVIVGNVDELKNILEKISYIAAEKFTN